MTSFADLVKSERHKRGLTQEEAAERVGVSTRTFRDWEKGRHRPRTFMARCVAQAFGVSQRQVLSLCQANNGVDGRGAAHNE